MYLSIFHLPSTSRMVLKTKSLRSLLNILTRKRLKLRSKKRRSKKGKRFPLTKESKIFGLLNQERTQIEAKELLSAVMFSLSRTVLIATMSMEEPISFSNIWIGLYCIIEENSISDATCSSAA